MVTEIPWGDGSRDKIYLTYNASTGDQTILVSSDANNYTERTKDIIFTSSVGSITKVLTVTQKAGSNYVSITFNDTCITFDDVAIAYPEGYIIFADTVVEQICATNWGDSVGLTPSQAAQVTSIRNIFNGNTDITSFEELKYFISLPSGSMTDAFTSSTLEKVALPQGIKLSNSTLRTFRYCSSLQEIDISDAVRDSGNLNYGVYWFSSATSLTVLRAASIESLIGFARGTTWLADDIPFNANTDTHYVYINGEELRNLIVPNTITEIRMGSFYRFNRLLSAVIPNSVTKISRGAFYQCTSLETLSLGNNVEEIGVDAFRECTALTGQISTSATNIGSAAFKFSIITSVILSGSGAVVNSSAFEDCTEITSISLPANVTLGLGAFRRCTSLQTVTLNGSFTTSGGNCFSNDTAVNTLNISSLNDYCASTMHITHGTPTAATTENVHVYEISSGNEITTVTVPNTVTEIYAYMFRNWAYITSLTVPSTVTAISSSAFQNCSSLQNLTINTDYTFTGDPFYRAGALGSTVTVNGDFQGTNNANGYFRFATVIINGDCIYDGTNTAHAFGRENSYGTYDFVLRISGDVYPRNTAQFVYNEDVVFIEIGGQITLPSTTCGMYNRVKQGCIIHLGYNGIAVSRANYFMRNTAIISAIDKIYVDSQAVLDQYLADSDWSQYSDKLDLWSNYNGPYKN